MTVTLSPPAGKLKVMVEPVVEMKVKVKGGVMKMNVNGGEGGRIRVAHILWSRGSAALVDSAREDSEEAKRVVKRWLAAAQFFLADQRRRLH